jgi:hypothetical protein
VGGDRLLDHVRRRAPAGWPTCSAGGACSWPA